ncbi:MAG: [FeFe] hydrogenase H-cluster maturation GTPase HydF [Prevotellaceae bacterium]|jgi:[FeFe] hydrogenase H-cluster maturation GTPase HydF|nr:[FeFe] hydrogenase H-cluster maturation GTPase HydF [Prevotellaceae bacterium]
MAKENKLHIGIYGRRNVGKSSLINFLTGQQVAIVSEQKGTTTDPVKRSFEILGIGPVIFIDTAGIDDESELGQARIVKTNDTINTIDFAIIVTDDIDLGHYENDLISALKKVDVSFILVYNKSDLYPANAKDKINQPLPHIFISTKNEQDRDILIGFIKKQLPQQNTLTLLGDLLKQGDIVLLITPIDNEAPQGRLILPQVTAIRDILDNNAVAIVLKENEVSRFLEASRIKPALAVTDSQIFKQANELIPKDISLTSFSILMARMKGNFETYLQGVHKISELKDGDRVLMLENCSHQSSCDDIGREKIPAWIRKFTGKQLEFDMVQGLDMLTRPVTDYALAIQCGGCMVTHRQLLNRLKPVIGAGVLVTNYGMAIAYTQGIFKRATELFVK